MPYFIRTSLAANLLLLSALPVAAQEARPVLGRDAVSAGVRSIEWLVDSIDDSYRSKGLNIVISRKTRALELVTGNVGEVVAVRRGNQRTVDFEAADLQQIERRAGLPVTSCDTLSGTDLCGIAEPWLWVVVADMSIQGDRATVVLEATDLAHGPGGQVEPQGATYEVVLQRERGSWRVVWSKHKGIT
jgi:hypothetical protein